MEAVFTEAVAQPRLQLVLLGVFGTLAGVLATVGIYGVVAYSAARRTREIGIRVALGATPNHVRRLMLRKGMMLGLAGIGIGIAGALAVTRLMRSLLYEITPTDPATLTAVAALMLAIVFAASSVPMNRAARTSPVVALRYE